MSVDVKTLEALAGKQVILHLIQEDGSVSEINGKIEAAAEYGIAFKEKGKRDVDLVELSSIDEVVEAASKPRGLPQKKLRAVTVASARTHLLERHGLTRTEVNRLTDEEAFDQHNEIDHTDLGHDHNEPEVNAETDEG